MVVQLALYVKIRMIASRTGSDIDELEIHNVDSDSGDSFMNLDDSVSIETLIAAFTLSLSVGTAKCSSLRDASLHW